MFDTLAPASHYHAAPVTVDYYLGTTADYAPHSRGGYELAHLVTEVVFGGTITAVREVHGVWLGQLEDTLIVSVSHDVRGVSRSGLDELVARVAAMLSAESGNDCVLAVRPVIWETDLTSGYAAERNTHTVAPAADCYTALGDGLYSTITADPTGSRVAMLVDQYAETSPVSA